MASLPAGEHLRFGFGKKTRRWRLVVVAHQQPFTFPPTYRPTDRPTNFTLAERGRLSPLRLR